MNLICTWSHIGVPKSLQTFTVRRYVASVRRVYGPIMPLTMPSMMGTSFVAPARLTNPLNAEQSVFVHFLSDWTVTVPLIGWLFVSVTVPSSERRVGVAVGTAGGGQSGSTG